MAVKIDITRVKTNEHGTFGVLSLDGVPVCVTLEETWLDNQKNISCVPSGIYDVVSHTGAKYKDVWRLLNVPNRNAILIHWGNTERDTEGCILVGRYFEKFGQAYGVADSRNTIMMLRRKLPSAFELLIKDCFKDEDTGA